MQRFLPWVGCVLVGLLALACHDTAPIDEVAEPARWVCDPEVSTVSVQQPGVLALGEERVDWPAWACVWHSGMAADARDKVYFDASGETEFVPPLDRATVVRLWFVDAEPDCNDLELFGWPAGDPPAARSSDDGPSRAICGDSVCCRGSLCGQYLFEGDGQSLRRQVLSMYRGCEGGPCALPSAGAADRCDTWGDERLCLPGDTAQCPTRAGETLCTADQLCGSDGAWSGCEYADVSQDVENCSACGHRCPTEGVHVVATCVDGVCGTRCEAGYIDEDGAPGCETACTPVFEGADADATCDGEDDDCDGEVDEDAPSRPTTCGAGACASEGLESCRGGVLVDDCTPGRSSVEVCDGIDNDCDGPADEDIAPEVMFCGEGACRVEGETVCSDGLSVDVCMPGNPGRETCDGTDEDCDGTTDEDVPVLVTDCGVGACARTGESSCQGGAPVDSCVPGGSVPEICDGVDNDCDSATDEALGPVPTECGIGACAAVGERTCSAGEWSDSCTPGRSRAEICDGQDNDCDGETDEGLEPRPTECGEGLCAAVGEERCVDGAWVNDCQPGERVDEVCNGLDDDCNGVADNGFDLDDDPLNCGSCGTVCAFDNGVAGCSDGACRLEACDDGWNDVDQDPRNGCEVQCDTPAGRRGPERCDGFDNDCDGHVDEIGDACFGYHTLTGLWSCGQCRRVRGNYTCKDWWFPEADDEAGARGLCRERFDD